MPGADHRQVFPAVAPATAVVCLLTCLYLCSVQVVSAQIRTTNSAAGSGPVAVVASDRQPIVVDAMTTVLIRDATLSARESGLLKNVQVTPGTLVTSGQLLAVLDDERQVLAVRAAELSLEIARSNAADLLAIETARAQVREAEQAKKRFEIAAEISSLVASSDVSIRVAEKTRDFAEFELERARKAREAFAASVSTAELNRLQVMFDQRVLEIEKTREDQSVSALKPKADQAAVAEQTETIARSRLLLSQREREQKVAAISADVAANELELAKLQLERRRLTAPFDGMIVTTDRQAGEWVEAGTTVLRLIQLDRMRVDGFLDASLAVQPLTGRAVTIQFSKGSSLPEIAGVITFISPEIDPINQQVRISAEFDNPGQLIRSGLVARMTIAADDKPLPAARDAAESPRGARQ